MEAVLIPIFICVVMPVMIVWLIMRAYMNRDNARRDIIISALEKNPNVDIKDFLEKTAPAQKSKLLKEKLLNKLLWGCICLISSVILAVVSLVLMKSDAQILFCLISAPFFAVGVAFLLNYFIGKKMLAPEVDAEMKEKQNIQ